MRRLVFPVIAAIGLVMVGPSSAFADDPAPTVSVKATAGKKVCKVTDPLLDELSGIVATSAGFIVINDSTDKTSHQKIFFLDTKCKIVNQFPYSGKGPRDPEDLILSPDKKTLWIADIGDNNFNKEDGSRRDTIGLWKMPADGSKKPTLYRLAYPQGDYHDAEALLFTNGTTPLIITKEIGKAASIYEPSGPLQANTETGVPLRKVGSIAMSATETAGNPYARIGNKTIDGGAIAPGGGKVVLRTYTDALEWDVTNGDVLGAITKGKPRYTGLPNETLGEAISYSADGKYLYTVSDMSGDTDAANYILQYTPSTEVAAVKKASATAAGGKKWYADLTIDQITYAVGAVGLLGLLLVGAGVLGIVRHRKRVALLPPLPDRDDDPGDPETELIGVGGAPERAGVYGGARSGPVYGGQQAAGGPPGGGVYGGAPQYARPQGQPRGPQGQPRAPQGQPRAPQGQPRGPQQGGGRPRGPQQGQPRGPQPGRDGVYGAPGGGQQYGQPRGPQRPQRPAGPQGGGGGQGQQQGGGPAQGRPQYGQQPRPAQGDGPRSQGVYGQPGSRDGGRPPQRDNGYADRDGRPESRFDNPGYRR